MANTKKGSKPDFHGAAKPEHAKELYDYFYCQVQNLYAEDRVKNGVFQAMMEVGLVNDGPVRPEQLPTKSQPVALSPQVVRSRELTVIRRLH